MAPIFTPFEKVDIISTNQKEAKKAASFYLLESMFPEVSICIALFIEKIKPQKMNTIIKTV